METATTTQKLQGQMDDVLPDAHRLQDPSRADEQGPDVYHCGNCGKPDCGFCMGLQAATCRAHRLYPQRYKLRENRDFKENPLVWAEGNLVAANGCSPGRKGISVEGDGKRLCFDFSKDVWVDDALAVLRDLLRIQYAWDLKNRKERAAANDHCMLALAHLQAAIESMDKRAVAIHGYSAEPLEASISPQYGAEIPSLLTE